MKLDFTSEGGKRKAKIVKAVIFLVLGSSAWMGVWLSGMDWRWAMFLSAVGGTLTMLAGAVVAGVMYQQIHWEMQEKVKNLTHLSEGTLGKMKLDLENLERTNKEGRRNLCMASVVMAKVISERVAARLISRYSKCFPNEEHIESAMREANEVVAEEIVTYSNSLQEMVKKV